MTKQKLFTPYLLILTTALLTDQISKWWGQQLESFIPNHGFFLGMASGLPLFIRSVVLSSFFGFIFAAYLALLYFLPTALIKLRLGLSLFCAGIFGNVLDKAWHGYTIDFIPIQRFGLNLYFNLADILQWLGAAIILWNIFKMESVIWFPANQRDHVVIKPREQFQFALKLTVVSLCASLLQGLFCLSFIRTMYFPQGGKYATSSMLAFAGGYLSLSLLFGLLVFVAGIYLSARTVGPLYAFERYIAELLKGQFKPFVLRAGDDFHHLEILGNQLKTHFHQKKSSQNSDDAAS